VGRAMILDSLASSDYEGLQALFEIDPGSLVPMPGYEGCRNIVYFFKSRGADRVLRISCRDDRDRDSVQGELDFIAHLAGGGMSVALPLPSRNARLVEDLVIGEAAFPCVSFAKAAGERLPDRGYRYRQGAPIEEYYRNFGAAIGRMHNLAKSYRPSSPEYGRPAWLDGIEAAMARYLPQEMGRVAVKFRELIDELRERDRGPDSYGLCHCDFNDGNFAIDYSDGTITVFDFDDVAYNSFMYDIADAWRCGLGWAMREADAGKRKERMDHWFGRLMEGYAGQNSLQGIDLSKLPLFLKAVEMEGVLDGFRSLAEEGESLEDDDGLRYALRCVEEDIPYFGLYDSIFSPEHPFELEIR